MTEKKLTKRQRRDVILRRICYTLLSLVVLCVVLVAALPTLFSYDWSRNHILGLVNRTICGKVTVGSASVGWTTSQTIQDIAVLDPQGNPIVKVKRLFVDSSLLKLLIPPHYTEVLEVNEPWVSLVQEADGCTNLDRAFASKYASTPMHEASFVPIFAANTPKLATLVQLPVLGNLKLTNGYFALKYKEEEPFIFSDLQAHISAPFMPTVVTARVSGVSKQGELSGSFHIDATVKGFDHRGRLRILENDQGAIVVDPGENVHIKAHIDNWPVEIFDRFLAKRDTRYKGPLFSEALGRSLSLTIDQYVTPEGSSIDMKAGSKTLNADLSINTETDSISLRRPGYIYWTVTPRLLALLNPEQHDLGITQPVTVQLTMNQFMVPLGSTVENAAPISLGAELLVPDLSVVLPGGSRVSLHQFKTTVSSPNLFEGIQVASQMTLAETNNRGKLLAQATIKHLFDEKGELTPHAMIVEAGVDASKIPTSFIEGLTGTSGLLTDLLGDSINGLVVANAQPGGAGTLQLKLSNDVVDGTMDLALKDLNILSLKPGARLMYTVWPDVLHKLVPSAPRLEGATTITMRLEPVTVPLHDFLLSSLALTGTVEADSIVFANAAAATHPALKHIKAKWFLDSPQNRATLDINAQPALGDKDLSGSVAISGTLNNWRRGESLDFSRAKVQASATIRQLPSGVAGALVDVAKLPEILGPNMDLTLQSALTPGGNGSLLLVVKSQHLEANAKLNVENHSIVPQTAEPLTLNWTMTPEAFSELQQPNTRKLKLKEPTQLSLTISRLQLPWAFTSDKLALDLSKIALNGTLGLNKMVLESAGGRSSAALRDVHVKIDTSSFTENMQWEVAGTGDTTIEGITTPATFNLKGNVQQALSPQGTFDLNALGARIDGRIKNLPFLLISQLAAIDPNTIMTLDPLVGPLLDIDVALDLKQRNGNCSLRLQGMHSRASLDAQLTDGVLTLSQPMEMQCQVTPKLSKRVLGRLNPLLLTAVKADNPLVIKIDPKDFRLPIMPFDLKQTVIGRAMIDSGKVTVENGGTLAKVLGFLQASALTTADKIDLWFTPQYVTMQNGMLRLLRSDLLIDYDYHIATWGDVNFNDDQLNIFIGITGDTLRSAFSLRNIPTEQMLVLKVKGTTANPRLDTARAATQLATLVAQNQAGNTGGFIQGIVDALQDNSQNVPKPSVQPFPWHNDSTYLQKQQQRQSQQTQQQQTQPSLQSVPGVDKLLQKIFKR